MNEDDDTRMVHHNNAKRYRDIVGSDEIVPEIVAHPFQFLRQFFSPTELSIFSSRI